MSDSLDILSRLCRSSLFFFNDTATTEIYTLSLHDALPILAIKSLPRNNTVLDNYGSDHRIWAGKTSSLSGQGQSVVHVVRSEEHTSELQSPCNLVCRLLLEKKKERKTSHPHMSFSSS